MATVCASINLRAGRLVLHLVSSSRRPRQENGDYVIALSLIDAPLKDGDDARLKTRATERHRIATDVVAFTDRMTKESVHELATNQFQSPVPFPKG